MKLLVIMLFSGCFGWGIHYWQYGHVPKQKSKVVTLLSPRNIELRELLLKCQADMRDWKERYWKEEE